MLLVLRELTKLRAISKDINVKTCALAISHLAHGKLQLQIMFGSWDVTHGVEAVHYMIKLNQNI